jgi:hypothetical protein
MLNQLEEDSVRQVVKSLVNSGTLFTALDVSNEVKKTLPQVRHREVRDVVRAMYTTDIEPVGWTRTDITVSLEDGSSATALLYYPLSSSWDLDTLYSNQKRTQTALKMPASNPLASVSSNGTVMVAAVAPAASSPLPVTVTPATTQAAARDLWKQMFSSQPSLFPRR